MISLKKVAFCLCHRGTRARYVHVLESCLELLRSYSFRAQALDAVARVPTASPAMLVDLELALLQARTRSAG